MPSIRPHPAALASLIVSLWSPVAPILVSAAPIDAQTRRVGDELFAANSDLEASGLVWIGGPNNLLAGVSDTGAVFMLNPDDDTEWYVVQSVSGLPTNYGDFEGVAVDTSLVGEDHLYIINEYPPALLKISFTLPSDGHDMTAAFQSEAVVDDTLFPPFETSKGLESLTLYSPSDAATNTPAQFLVGLQDNGVIYGIDSNGDGTDVEFDGGLQGLDGVSGSYFDIPNQVLYTVYDNQNGMAAVDVLNACTLKTWTTEATQEEGLAFRATGGASGNGVVYIASDEGGNDPSFIAEHDWSVPTLPASCPPVCGDGICGEGEDCTTCSDDCSCPASCGDGICGEGEDCTTCSDDCPGKTNGKTSSRYCCEAGGVCTGQGCPTADCTGGGVGGGGLCSITNSADCGTLSSSSDCELCDFCAWYKQGNNKYCY